MVYDELEAEQQQILLGTCLNKIKDRMRRTIDVEQIKERAGQIFNDDSQFVTSTFTRIHSCVIEATTLEDCEISNDRTEEYDVFLQDLDKVIVIFRELAYKVGWKVLTSFD